MPRAPLDALLSYVSREGRVCPQPGHWEELRKLLGPASPQIAVLGGWYVVPPIFKVLILKAQIEYAAEHGKLEKVDRFLRGLGDRDWYCDAWIGQERKRAAKQRERPKERRTGASRRRLPLPL